MCCDICPYFDECEDTDELQDDCCRECPEYPDCQNKDDTEDEDGTVTG